MRGPTYLEWATGSPLVACAWALRFGSDGAAHVDRVIPDGCVDLLWTPGGLVVAGPDTESSVVPPWPDGRILGVRFHPGIAPAVLGMPASELTDQRVDARDVLGARVAPLYDALASIRSARGAALVLAGEALKWRCAEPDGLVQRALVEVARGGSVAAIAAQLGVSERQLRRRFVDAIGYAPKTFQRITRLRRFVALAARKTPLVDIALDAGYADQPHLNREIRALTGCTPTQLAGYPVTAG